MGQSTHQKQGLQVEGGHSQERRASRHMHPVQSAVSTCTQCRAQSAHAHSAERNSTAVGLHNIWRPRQMASQGEHS
eukprot:1161743-Pelagomonas_calceolata.AAC.10